MTTSTTTTTAAVPSSSPPQLTPQQQLNLLHTFAHTVMRHHATFERVRDNIDMVDDSLAPLLWPRLLSATSASRRNRCCPDCSELIDTCMCHDQQRTDDEAHKKPLPRVNSAHRSLLELLRDLQSMPECSDDEITQQVDLFLHSASTVSDLQAYFAKNTTTTTTSPATTATIPTPSLPNVKTTNQLLSNIAKSPVSAQPRSCTSTTSSPIAIPGSSTSTITVTPKTQFTSSSSSSSASSSGCKDLFGKTEMKTNMRTGNDNKGEEKDEQEHESTIETQLQLLHCDKSPKQQEHGDDDIRNERIHNINRDTHMICEMSKDINKLVAAHGEELRTIGANIEQTRLRVDTAEVELQQAAASVLTRRRVVTSVALGCVGASLGFVAGGPILGLAVAGKMLMGGGGAMLGAWSGRALHS